MDNGQVEQTEALARSLLRSEAAKYLHVASAALFMWDHIVTLQQEFDLVWRSRWGVGKILFLVVRYMTWPEVMIAVYREIVQRQPALCHPFFVYTTWSSTIGTCASEMILILRTWAIWSGRRILLVPLAAAFVFGFCGCSYVINIYISKTHLIAAETLSPVLRGCFITASSRMITIPWLILIAFDSVIVVLTMIKGVQHFKTGTSGLITTLYRDGILYFIYILVIYLANILVVYLSPPEYTALLSELQRVLQAIFSCRIILHLRAHDVPNAETLGSLTAGPQTGGGVSAWFGNASRAESESSDPDVELSPFARKRTVVLQTCDH